MSRLDVATDRPRVVVSFRPDVTLERDADAIAVGHPWGGLRLRGLDRATAEALAELAAGGVEPATVEVPHVRTLLERLAPALTRSVVVGRRRLATAVPMAAEAVLRPRVPVAPETRITLSPFAYLRRSEDGALLESPLSRHRIVLHDAAAAALVGTLAGRRTVGAAAAAVPDLGLDAGRAVVDLLVAADIVELDAEPEDPGLALWDFHDLVFHSRSRLGRHDHPFGGLYRHGATHEPVEAVASPGTGTLIPLPRPDWTDVVGRDPTLTEALESRRSVRDYDATPITKVQLGELLYRAARIRGVVPVEPEGVPAYNAVDRPFPTGGGSGELELYLTVARCEGLDAGAYHYDAAAHGLRRLDATERDRSELLGAAWRAAAGRVDPQVLITITSRFGRLSWKYSSIAYALTLKHVGVLYQTLYLVATAMGLAPCALGSGDADAAARAFGLDWATESSVGEFLIGSRPGDAPGPATAFADIGGRPG
jgi:SagB-type dehydrogenase family enzyme